MTLNEIKLVIDAYSDSVKNKNNDIYNNAYLTAMFIGSMLAGKEVPTIDEVFPTEENIKARQEYELRKFKSQMQSFAMGHNKQGG